MERSLGDGMEFIEFVIIVARLDFVCLFAGKKERVCNVGSIWIAINSVRFVKKIIVQFFF